MAASKSVFQREVKPVMGKILKTLSSVDSNKIGMSTKILRIITSQAQRLKDQLS